MPPGQASFGGAPGQNVPKPGAGPQFGAVGGSGFANAPSTAAFSSGARPSGKLSFKASFRTNGVEPNLNSGFMLGNYSNHLNSPVLKWSKDVQFVNGLAFNWYLNTGLRQSGIQMAGLCDNHSFLV